MSLWKLGTGKKITGQSKDSFLGDYSDIPDGTTCDAYIKSFMHAESKDKRGTVTDSFLEIKWKIVNGEFKNREVGQKIKIFSGKPESIDRNLNMLMLIMNMFEYPVVDEVPSDADLMHFNGKMAAIKIGLWEMAIIKDDGTDGFIHGNNVREVHPTGTLEIETGVVKESAKHTSAPTPAPGREPLDSALSRQRAHAAQAQPDIENQDIPF